PIVPIVVYITGGRGSGEWEEYREQTFEELIVLFRFRRLRLRAFKAVEAVREGDPLVCALAALMDRRGADLAELKVASLPGIGESALDEARQGLLVNSVETYLPLSTTVEQRYQVLLEQEEHRMAKRTQLTWFDQVRE